MRARCLILLLCALWVLGASAEARKPRCRLERVELVPDSDEVRVFASVVELEGEVARRPPGSFALLLNDKELARAEAAVPFDKSGIPTYMVLAVEVSALYSEAIEPIKEALGDFLDALPASFRVKVLPFGNEVESGTPFASPSAVRQAIEDLNPDDEGEVQMLEALTRGLRSLNTLKAPPAKEGAAETPPPQRRIMVVLSDGLNPVMERALFRKFGDNLRRFHVPLFPVGFSARDDRGPLLNLGELSKRSSGTFRWAQGKDDLKERFQSLAAELKQLQVLTFRSRKLSPDKLSSGALQLRCDDLRSVPLVLDKPAQAGGSRWWRWALYLLGGLAVLWLGAKGLVLLLDRLARRAQQPPAPQAPPPQPQPAPQPHQSAYPQPHQSAYPQPHQSAYPQPRPPAPTQPQPAVYTPPPAYTAPPPQPQPARRGPALLMIGAVMAGQRVPLDGPSLVLGKAATGPGALTIAGDPTVSSRHCEISRDAAGYVFTDLGSTNGSFINDVRVQGPTRLRPGDVIRIGTGTVCRFVLE